MFQVERVGRRVVLTLDRPPVNAINGGWLERFHAVLDEVDAYGDVAVLHLRSACRVFSAGADLVEVERNIDSPAERMESFVREMHRLFDRLEGLPCVTLAEIGGVAYGGGLELALACDLRIASDDASLGLPEARLGLIPGAGGTQRLTRLCGPGTAARLILGCDIVSGTTARELGIVQWSVPAEELAAAARVLGDRIAGLAAEALRVSKRCIAAQGGFAREGYALEIGAQRVLITSPETASRVRAFLSERRKRHKD